MTPVAITLTATQQQTLQQLADATRPCNSYQQNASGALYFNEDSSKIYAPSHGMNGAALRSLMTAGLVEKYDSRIYKHYYRLTEEGLEALEAALAPELPEPLEVLGVGDYVHVTPHYMQRPYFAWVEVVNYETGRVVTSHWSYGYVNEYGFEEVRLVLKKDAAEIEMTASR